jgi:hypothetical protein
MKNGMKSSQTTKKFVKKSSLTKILIDWGRLFHDINHGNIVLLCLLAPALSSFFGSPSKFFMYVAKTRANLSTYSGKQGNYNVAMIDVMKKSSPIN